PSPLSRAHLCSAGRHFSGYCGPPALLAPHAPFPPGDPCPAVVADDAATPVGVGKTGNDARPPAALDLRRVDVEHAVVVRFTILGERFVNLRVGIKTCGLQACFDHAQAAERENRALEGL